MKITAISIVSIIGAALVAMPKAYSQSHPSPASDNELHIINAANAADTAHTTRIIEVFRDNAPSAYNIPGVPRFAIEGKDRKFYLGIGAAVKATVSYDFGNPIENGYDFTTSIIPMTKRKGDGALVQFNAASSSMYLNFVALPGDENQIGAYFNANLTGGNNYGFKTQYAYVKFRGITAGYNYSLFSDMAAAPPSIDNEGPNGFTALPHGVLDYQRSFAGRWKFGVGLEMPAASATTNEVTYMVTQRVPDIPAYIQISWGGGSNWLRLSGLLRNMTYRDVRADRNRNVVGWGFQLSGSAAINPSVRAYYQATTGRGISSYYQDLNGGGLDMVPAGDGRLKSVGSWGGFFGVQYTISPTVYATTTYSHVRVYPHCYSGGTTAWGDQYKYAQYMLANLIWNITPVVQTGVEYIYGRRVNLDDAQAHDNRIQTMLRISF